MNREIVWNQLPHSTAIVPNICILACTKQNSLAWAHENSNIEDKLQMMMSAGYVEINYLTLSIGFYWGLWLVSIHNTVLDMYKNSRGDIITPLV